MIATADRQDAQWLNRHSYPFTPNYLQVEGGRMHYVDQGQGEPIVFVHGTPTWSYLFRHLIRDLSADGYRCVAPDHIGFGLSEKPADFSYSPGALTRNLGKLIDELDLHDITLVIHDFGGPIGMGYAVDHPERIKRIVLLNTWVGDVSKEPAAEKIGKMAVGPLGKFLYLSSLSGPKMIKPLFVDRDKYTEEIQNAYFGPFLRKEDRHGTFALAKHLIESSAWFNEIWSCREVLLGKQMMLLWGMKDPTFGEKTLNRIWHEFPLAEVHTLKDAGHFALEENPRQVLNFMRDFLKMTASASTGYLS
ncbi:alpha/beta fold hydrolase [Fimbriimonas ginsengisoli]|uniref:Alpha/beta fold superfamily hydrolase n=1 Tax=Fimbriimonas ginsengisoli Gsoil 348 TaxID=661478 RepID=A0A068NQR8_FIMGI|nr:alpha/beta fold hydrolase [Fimbriimonas ginsengisoli]AIE85055.1 alpha/beta fold superfamily hydrolase [Fimbriimonas ginsengisoli Gsoil 348]